MEINREEYSKRYEGTDPELKPTFFVATLLATRFTFDETVNDLKLAINDKKWNFFGDIVIEVDYINNKKKIYVVKTTHTPICTENFETLNLNNVSFITCTNDFTDEHSKNCNSNYKQQFCKTTNGSRSDTEYKYFNEEGELLQLQENIHDLKNNILTIFKEQFDCNGENIIEKFSEFVQKRSEGFKGKYYKLNKSDVFLKIIELLISDFIVKPTLKRYNKHHFHKPIIELYRQCGNLNIKVSKDDLLEIWNDLINSVNLTLFNSTDKNIVNDLFISIFRKIFIILNINPKQVLTLNHILNCKDKCTENLKVFSLENVTNVNDKISLKLLHITCWKTGLIPLVINYNENNKSLFEKIIDTSKKVGIKISFVLLYKDKISDVNYLQDIKSYNLEIYNKILTRFPISIQNRYNCIINDLPKNILEYVTIKHIMQMALNKLIVGNNLNSTKKIFYIERNLSATVFNLDTLNNDEDIFIVDNLPNTFESKHNVNNGSSKNITKNTHCLKYIEKDKGFLVHVNSEGSLKNLYDYQKNKVINEESFIEHYLNNFTLIYDAPGMGKTCLINKIINYVPGYWVAKLKLDKYSGQIDNVLSQFFEEKFENNDPLFTKIYEYFCREKRMLIFLDDFKNNRLIPILKTIQESEYQLIITITTLKQDIMKTLKDELNIFPFFFAPLDFKATKKFVRNYFNNKLTKNNLDKILQCFKGISKEISCTPDLVNLVCEVHNYFDIESFDLITILEHYLKLNLYKYHVESTIIDKYKQLSLLVFFDKNRCESVFSADLQDFIQKIKRSQEKNCLITSIDNEGFPIFKSILIAKYLTALWLAENYKRYPHIIEISKCDTEIRYLFELILKSPKRNIINLTPLHIVVNKNNSSNTNRKTPLFLAFQNRNKKGLKKLLKSKNLDVHNLDYQLNTALHYAVKYNYQSAINMLLKKDVDVNAMNCKRETAIYFAIRNKSLISCTKLINHGADVNISNAYFNTPLHVAVLKNSKNILEKLLLKRNCGFISKNYKGRTPIALAVESNRYSLFKTLKSYNCDINTTDILQMNLLHLAVYYDSRKILCDLLEKNKNLLEKKNYWGETPLLLAIKLGNEILFDKLKKVGAKLDVVDCSQNTPLHLAMLSKNTDIIRIILQSNVNLNVRNLAGKTPIHLLVSFGKDNIFEQIDVSKVNLNECDNYGNTPLHFAINYKNKEAIKWLIQSGADFYISNCRGRNSIHFAAQHGVMSFFENIKDEIDVNDPDYVGKTALFFAVNQSRIDMVKHLLSIGAEVDFNIKECCNNDEIKKLLESKD